MTPVDLMNPNVVILPDANGGSTIVQDFELAHPVILGPNTDDDVPGCALSEDDLDAETLKQLEGAGHIKVYPNRIQVVGAPRPVDTMIARFGSTFRVLDRVMPKRVLDEEFGDALEAMQRVANDPRHRFPRIVIGL